MSHPPLHLVLLIFWLGFYLCSFFCFYSVCCVYVVLFCICFVFLGFFFFFGAICGFESPWLFTVSSIGGDSLLLKFILLDDRSCFVFYSASPHSGCCLYLARVCIELKGIVRVIPLSVSLFGVRVGLKGLMTVISLPVSLVLVI